MTRSPCRWSIFLKRWTTAVHRLQPARLQPAAAAVQDASLEHRPGEDPRHVLPGRSARRADLGCVAKPAASRRGVQPDGRTLASASDDKTLRLWEGLQWRTPLELQRQIGRLVGTGLSRSEWAQYAPGIPYRTSCS